jgi:hypothetical protein
MVVPWIAVLVVDVVIAALFDSTLSDGLTPHLVTGRSVDLVPLRTVVLAIFFFVITLWHCEVSLGFAFRYHAELPRT